MPPHLSIEDQDKRLRFLEGLEVVAEVREYSTWRKVIFSMKRLIVQQRDSGGRISHYGVKQGLLMSGVVSKASAKTTC